MTGEKGTLVFDESSEIEVRKHILGHKTMFSGGGIFFILFGLFLFLAPFIDNIELNPNTQGLEWLFQIFGLIFIMVGAFFILASFGIKNLKVYENGIALPYTPPDLVLKKEESYYPFESIKEIYWRDDRPYIIIEVRDHKNNRVDIDISKKLIKNMDCFIQVVSDKTKVGKY